MEFKFDKSDKKLISYLYHNYREPLTKIAKKCKLSRDQVEYRIKKYEEQGIIKKYATIFNYSALGYDEFAFVWLKLDCSEKEKNQLRKDLSESKNVMTYLDVVGEYDIVIDLVYRDKEDLEKGISEILGKHHESLKDYSVFITTSTSFFPLKEFGIKSPEKEFVIENSKEVSLDKDETKILKSLDKNGRAKIVDIASEAGISAELALYKLKRLYEKNVILGTRIVFDLEKMNYFFGSLRLKIDNLNQSLKNKIFDYCKNHSHVNAVSFGIGEYNCLIQVFYGEESDFRKSLREILSKFGENIKESDVLLIENEGRVKTLPF